MKILLSSQDFGFGPTTQMFAFIKHLLLNNFRGQIYIKENETTIIFYENFLKTNEVKNIFLVNTLIGNYDKYVGFYDPEIIFEGKKENKKTLFLCNLTFLWNLDLVKKYDNIKLENIKLKKINNHHELILLGYLLADKNFIRNTDGIDKDSLFYSLIKEKTEFIGPIIYPKIFERQEKDFILVQFGGQINPITNNDFYITYFKLIKKIIQNLKYKIKIIVNPLLEKEAKNIFKENEILTTLSQEEYQRLLSQAKALFSPFGINTFFESSYYNIPTFILPEQHIGHIKSILKYFGNIEKLKENNFLLYQLEKYSLDYEDEKEFITFLNSKYENLLNKNINIDFYNFFNNGENIINKMKLDKNINKDLEKMINLFISK